MSVRRLHAIQPESFGFTPENLAWAKQVIAKYPAGKQASAVIPLLWRAQEQNDNWTSKPVIEYVARMLDMSYIRVLEVATFYTMYQLQPVGRIAHIQVCGTTPCMLRGAEDLKKVCQSRIHPEQQHISADGNFSWEEAECLGACVNAPMVQIFKDTYEDLTPESFEKLIDDLADGRKIKPGPQIDRHLAAPEGGPTTLTDPGLYRGQRIFTRVEAASPAAAIATPAAAAPPAVAPAPVAPATPAPVAARPKEPPVIAPAGTPAPAAVAPKPEDIRPVTLAAKVADAARQKAETTAQASNAPGSPMDDRAQTENNITRASAHEVKAVAPVQSAADKGATPAINMPAPVSKMKPVAEIAPVKVASANPPEPGKLAAQKMQPARRPSPDGQPGLLKQPKGGNADDLKLVAGIGPKLEQMLNTMGIWHFDQIASWTAKELAWVDERLQGFKGRAKRDEWVRQSKKLANGWRPDNATGGKPGKK